MGIIADDGVIDMRMYLYFFSYVMENVEDEEKNTRKFEYLRKTKVLTLDVYVVHVGVHTLHKSSHLRNMHLPAFANFCPIFTIYRSLNHG